MSPLISMHVCGYAMTITSKPNCTGGIADAFVVSSLDRYVHNTIIWLCVAANIISYVAMHMHAVTSAKFVTEYLYISIIYTLVK